MIERIEKDKGYVEAEVERLHKDLLAAILEYKEMKLKQYVG